MTTTTSTVTIAVRYRSSGERGAIGGAGRSRRPARVRLAGGPAAGFDGLGRAVRLRFDTELLTTWATSPAFLPPALRTG
jgi:hypothetical protein